MQELVGRLTALDPEASETLKVVTYFDALVRAGAGVDALLRTAAALSGVTAGMDLRDRRTRRSPDGRRADGDHPAVRSPRRDIPGGEVWLEREGEHHANDEMVVERLALALELVEARHRPDAALEVAIDAERSVGDRRAALARLRIEGDARVRVLAIPVEDQVAGSIPVPVDATILRAVLDDGHRAIPARAGLGAWVRPERLPESWDSATVALRLTDDRHPVVDATDLGALLLLARAYDPGAAPADVRALAALDHRTRDVLRALAEAESIRAASATLGMHHSTLQARQESLTRELGYDPRTVLGRARYVAADLLLRLSPPA